MTSSDSLIDPHRELPEQLPDDLTVTARRDLARLDLDGGALVGGAAVGNVIVLDPVLTVVWDALDGTATLGDLVADVVEVLGGDPAERRRQVGWFLRSLHHDGLLVGSAGDPPVVPTPTFPRIPADSCLGRQLGLGRMHHLQLPTGDRPIRVGSTLPDVLDAIADSLPTMEVGDEPCETTYLRGTVGSGRVSRVQQVFDSDGDLVFAGRSLDDAVAALHACVAGRVAATAGGAWIEGIALLTDAGVTLVHPSMRATLLGALRRPLADRGVFTAPADVFRIEDAGRLTAVGAPLGADRAFRVNRILLPGASTGILAVRRLLDLVRTQDQAGFEGALRLARSAPILDVDLVQAVGPLTDAIVAAAH